MLYWSPCSFIKYQTFLEGSFFRRHTVVARLTIVHISDPYVRTGNTTEIFAKTEITIISQDDCKSSFLTYIM
jgi:hypothetical protein